MAALDCPRRRLPTRASAHRDEEGDVGEALGILQLAEAGKPPVEGDELPRRPQPALGLSPFPWRVARGRLHVTT